MLANLDQRFYREGTKGDKESSPRTGIKTLLRTIDPLVPPPGTSYFSKAGAVVDITGLLKLFLISVAALKSLGGIDKAGCASKRGLVSWRVLTKNRILFLTPYMHRE
jgi:hypothetical protein